MRLAALREAPYAFGSTFQHERALPDDRWRSSVTDRNRFVAEIDGTVAGTVSIGDTSGTAGITSMWVNPEFRRRGIGDLLVKTAVDWAKVRGYAGVVLWVTAGNADAERLYARNGFKPTGEAAQVRPGESGLEYEMELAF